MAFLLLIESDAVWKRAKFILIDSLEFFLFSSNIAKVILLIFKLFWKNSNFKKHSKLNVLDDI